MIEGLSPEVIYEMRVIARSDDTEGNGLEAMSGIQMVRISMKRGHCYYEKKSISQMRQSWGFRGCDPPYIGVGVVESP